MNFQMAPEEVRFTRKLSIGNSSNTNRIDDGTSSNTSPMAAIISFKGMTDTIVDQSPTQTSQVITAPPRSQHRRRQGGRSSIQFLDNIVESFRAHVLAPRPCDGDESAHGSQNSSTAEMLVKLESTENLSRGARRALRDFCNHLKVLKKKALDEEAFNTILDDMDYSRDRSGLFQDLLQEVSEAKRDMGLFLSTTTAASSVDGNSYGEGDESANPQLFKPKEEITVDDMLALYNSDPYHLLDDDNHDVGDVLMSYMDKLFDEVDTRGDGYLNREEVRDLLCRILEKGSEPTEEQLDSLFGMMHTTTTCDIKSSRVKEHGNERLLISRVDFKNLILKPNRNQDILLPETLNYNFYDPALVSNDDFVAELEKYCISHRAVEHHFLQNLAGAAFGKEKTLDLLVRFFTIYSGFTIDFVPSIEKLKDLLEKQEHKYVLDENMREENGFYDEETLCELESIGISRKSVMGVPHWILFREMVDTLEQRIKCSYRSFIPESIVSIKKKLRDELAADGKCGLLAWLYFGSELIVPKLYELLLQGLQNSCEISNQDVRFLILHIGMDHDHADKLRKIVVDTCNTMEERICIVRNAERVLTARVKFYELLRDQCDFRESGSSMKDYYNEQALACSSFVPESLCDRTCNPTLFDMCVQHTKGSTIIDVGCGEGYVGRHLKSMGAKKLIGVDVSDKMVDLAQNSRLKTPEEHYIVGDAVELRHTLLTHSAETNLMLGAQFDLGVFDLGVASQLFNDLTINDMNISMKQVYSLLKPGGYFVFSVPHPSLNQDEKSKQYFSLRDKQIEGFTVMTDGSKIESRIYYKTFEDYINAVNTCGFSLVDFKETRVSPRDLQDNPEFFSGLKDRPLYLIMKVRKPKSVSQSTKVSDATSIDLLPEKLIWNRTMANNFANVAEVILPTAANREVCGAALSCFEKGLTADDIVVGRDIDPAAFRVLQPFCKRLRTKLLRETGAVIVKGLDMKKLGGAENLDKMTVCSKIAYLIICEHIGTVDAGARGKLFDVKSSNIDVTDKKNDNVLFSVSDTEAGWHTDGASKDRVYDVVGLMCISPAAKGGKFRFSNACNVYDTISKVMPKFLMHEMTRALPRDILENGNGLGSQSLSASMSRNREVLKMRIRYNSYPIYESEGDRMRFRYMRYWIETGHNKTGWKVPTFLRIAMNILDDKLDEECVFHDALERGDIIFANNAMLAHARDAFKNAPGAPPRHKVRAWLQIQKADILTGLESEEADWMDY